jgi:B12-binding domain/radical SAM domain protein of rhizo-twelve system
MRIALANPSWDFSGSVYFGCLEPHLPLELAYAAARLEADGHEVLLADGHLAGIDTGTLAATVAAFGPDLTVVTTAPTYLFWRCAPPELRSPRALLDALDGRGGRTVAVGPHGSATPGATLRKLGVDVVVRGECEDVIAAVVARGGQPKGVAGTGWRTAEGVHVEGAPAVARGFATTPALRWPRAWILRHRHHHHRFDASPGGPGAEVEASRGCPFTCTFCAKLDYRDGYRRRDLGPLLDEIDGLIAEGVRYVYFIDEIFLPQPALLHALSDRDLAFGIQTRIDLWTPDMLRLLGEAGCVSIEAGVESLSVEGRAALDKRCKLTTDELADRLVRAKRHVPFVQANLIATPEDAPDEVARWRERVVGAGVWANDPVPLFPYPSSPAYRRRWGAPDDAAWERAHAHYLAEVARFSDIQDQRPLPLDALEVACGAR